MLRRCRLQKVGKYSLLLSVLYFSTLHMYCITNLLTHGVNNIEVKDDRCCDGNLNQSMGLETLNKRRMLENVLTPRKYD